MIVSDKDMERFMSKVELDPETGCMNWNSTLVWGYSKFKAQGKQWRGHRLIWILHHGEPEEGLVVRHRCDNKRCVNIDHLLVGTQAENIADKMNRNRQARGVRIGTSKLCPFAVVAIREEYFETSHLPGGASYVSLGEKYGVDNSIIGDIVTRRTWREIGGPISKPRAGRRKLIR